MSFKLRLIQVFIVLFLLGSVQAIQDSKQAKIKKWIDEIVDENGNVIIRAIMKSNEKGDEYSFNKFHRLVIIGNGFDLAHGLPTRYKHFIDDFWKNFEENCKTDSYKQIIFTDDAYNGYYRSHSEIKNFKDFKSNLFEYCKEYNYRFCDENCVAVHNAKDIFKIKNNFFF